MKQNKLVDYDIVEDNHKISPTSKDLKGSRYTTTKVTAVRDFPGFIAT